MGKALQRLPAIGHLHDLPLGVQQLGQRRPLRGLVVARALQRGAASGATLVDELGRRSWTSSIAFGPSIGKNIALAYLPHDYCQVGRELQIQYFADVYPVKVEAVGYQSLYDPENGKPKS